MRARNHLVWGLVLMLLSACSVLPKPQSISDQIAYTYGMVASARTTAAGMLDRDQITVAQASIVLQQTNTARQALDQARLALAGGMPQDAQSQLLLATQVLTAVEAYLKSKEK